MKINGLRLRIRNVPKTSSSPAHVIATYSQKNDYGPHFFFRSFNNEKEAVDSMSKYAYNHRAFSFMKHIRRR